MIAFRVYHNGTEVCTASAGPVGVLTAGITWVRRTGDAAAIPAGEAEQVECDLNVSALLSPTNEHLTWDCPELKLGDRVQIDIVEAAPESVPSDRYEDDGVAIQEAQKRYVRRMAALWGWTITEPSSSSNP